MTDTSNHDSDAGPEALDIFTEPADYYPPSPTPTTVTHTLLSGQSLSLRLVGFNPLWGHHLWNAGRIVSIYIEENSYLIRNKTVLELGAGAGLPSLVCGILGATKVVVSDYPDPDLIENLTLNIGNCPLLKKDEGEARVVAEGYCWGNDPQPLLSHLDSNSSTFDVLILADLLFNHSEHGKLISTIQCTLAKREDAKALVFFTPYRPWLYEKDKSFFDLARDAGFVVEKVLEQKMEKVMFEKDSGDEELRKSVFGYSVRWA